MRLPSDKLRNTAKETVQQFIRWSAQYRDDHLKEIEIWNKHYRVEQSVRSYDGRANTADGSSHEAVETIAPRIVEILTENGELKYEIAPVDTEADEEFVKAPNALIRADLKMADSRKKLVEAVRSLTKYGTIFVMPQWNEKRRTTNEPRYSPLNLVEIDESGTPIYEQRFLGYEKTVETVYTGVDWELVDLMSCWLDPFTPDVDKAQGFVVERMVSFEDLRRNQLRTETITEEGPNGELIRIRTQRGKYFKDALDELEKKLESESVEQKSGDEKGNIKKEQDKFTPRREVNIKTYWGWFDYDEDDMAEDCIITLAGEDEIPIQLEPSGYPRRPGIVCRYIPIPGQTYGIGVLGLTTKMQQMINDMQNQVLDDATISLLNMWRKDPHSDVDDSELRFGQNKVIEAAAGEIEQFERTIQLRHGFDSIAYNKEQIRTMTGATRSLQALPQKYHTTATEVSTMHGEASARLVLTAIVIETELIVPLLERIIEYNYAFMSDEKVVRLTNDPKAQEQLKAVTRADIAGQWDFTPLGATTYQRQLKERQERMEMAQAVALLLQAFLGGNPLMAQQLGFDIPLLIKGLIGTFDIPDKDKVFNPQGAQGGLPAPEDGGNGAAAGMPNMLEQFVANTYGGGI